MKEVNLRELYPDIYKTDIFVEVSEEILNVILGDQRAESAHQRKVYRYKAHYSLNHDNGIEKAAMFHVPTPEEIFENQQLREEIYSAIMALPEKQAKRIYARFYLNMDVAEIAMAEGVHASRVRDSIRRGLRQLEKMLRDQ